MTKPAWLREAEKEIGVREAPGEANNPAILAYGREAQIEWPYRADSIAWCALFVNAMLVRAGYPSTRSALARSFLDYGAALPGPRVGCLVVLPRGSSALYGHVGFCLSFTRTHIRLLGGNQADRVSVITVRRDSVLPRGYRWPDGAPGPSEPAAFRRLPAEVLLQTGSVGDEVIDLQAGLNVLGYGIAEDGVFGVETDTAVRRFQQAEELRVDGIVGPATRAALTTAVAGRQARAKPAKPLALGASTAAAAGAAQEPIEKTIEALSAKAGQAEPHLTSGDWLRVGLAVLLLSPALWLLGRWAWRRFRGWREVRRHA